jgi:hypothetical protein
MGGAGSGTRTGAGSARAGVSGGAFAGPKSKAP